MIADQFIAARVSSATKAALRAAAERQQLSESALVKRMIELMLSATVPADGTMVTSGERPSRLTRLYVRLTLGDWLLLRERANARCLAPATYASFLIRTHVRGVTPQLPKPELQAVRQSIAQLRAIGTLLNQIAKASYQGGQPLAPGREHLHVMLKVCEGLRDHIRALVRENAMNWEAGNGGH
jgi:hypothetical protein